jgi:hypothetical protein
MFCGRYRQLAWIEAAKKRLHHNVLAIALANKLARMAWAVLNKERSFDECATVLGSVKAWPGERAARPDYAQSVHRQALAALSDEARTCVSL